jgi:hypothetical protein
MRGTAGLASPVCGPPSTSSSTPCSPSSALCWLTEVALAQAHPALLEADLATAEQVITDVAALATLTPRTGDVPQPAECDR